MFSKFQKFLYCLTDTFRQTWRKVAIIILFIRVATVASQSTYVLLCLGLSIFASKHL